MQHFEELWETAEQKTTNLEEMTALEMLAVEPLAMACASKDDKEKIESIIGRMLLMVAVLSRTNDINVFAALKGAVDDHLVDQDVGSDTEGTV